MLTKLFFIRFITVLTVLSLLFAGVGPQPVLAEAPNVVVTLRETPMQTGEGGATALFDVHLTDQPLTGETVTIPISSSNTGEGQVSAAELVFNDVNYLTDQTITISGVNDAVDDGDQVYTVVLGPAVSGDPLYNGQDSDDISVTNVDNDTAGLEISGAPLATSEDGTSDTFSVALSSQPLASVTLTITSSDTGEAVVADGSLTFTTGNWATPQDVTITGQPDSALDGDQPYTINLSASGGGYNAVTGAVNGTNFDTDSAGLVISGEPLTTDENGLTDSFSVRLSAAPSSTVTVAVGTTDTDEISLDRSSLTFTTGNWNDPQSVTATGEYDSLLDGDQPFTITLSASGDGYAGVTDSVSGTNQDTSQAGIIIDGGSLTTDELGGLDTFRVLLAATPTGTVTITLTTAQGDEVSISPSTLTFNAGNWQTLQEVTITGLPDPLLDGDQPFTINLSASGGGYTGLTESVSGTNADTDTAYLVITGEPLATSENATTDTFSVALSAAPAGTVTISVASSDTGEAIAAPSSLTFNPGDWSTAQEVTVTGVNDSLLDGSQPYTINLNASGSGFDGADTTVSGANADNDTAALVVSKTDVSTSEDATGDSFNVRLSAAPAGTVTVTVASDDTSEATASPTGLSFNSGNWAVDQLVNVSGVNDNLLDGIQSYTINLSASGNGFSGASAAVNGTNADNDTPSLIVAPGSVITGEDGTDAEITIHLGSVPATDVTVTVSSSDPTEAAVNPTTLTFTPANSDTDQTVTVSGADDTVQDGEVAYTIDFSASGGGYSGQTAQVTGSNTDNEVAGIIASKATLVTGEPSLGDSFTARLNTQPLADVVITVVSSDTSEATVNPASLTFTSLNWNTPQTVSVTPVNDSLADGTVPYTVTLTVSPSTPAYAAAPLILNGSNSDDDLLALVVSQPAGITTTEAAGDNPELTIGVRLNGAPGGSRAVSIVSSDPSEGQVSTGSLTFTDANWNVTQNVTVTGVDDPHDDGDVAYNITFTAAGLQGSPKVLSYTNIDNDAAGFSITPLEQSISTYETPGHASHSTSFTIALTSQPINTVILTFTSGDLSEGTVSPSQITFGNAPGWETPRTITVTGVDDNLKDGNATYNVTGTISTVDSIYSTLSVPSITVTNFDDDIPPVTADDGYSFVQNMFSMPEPGVFLNDSNPLAALSVVVSVPAQFGEVQLDPLTGAFTYRLTVSPPVNETDRSTPFAWEDSFSYTATYAGGESTAVVHIHQTWEQYDALKTGALPEEFVWTQPVSTDKLYIVLDQSVTLEVEVDPAASDVAWIQFYRWDHRQDVEEYVLIGSANSAPYRISFPSSDLISDGNENQIFAIGYNNGGQVTRRARIRLLGWLGEMVYIPFVAKR